MALPYNPAKTDPEKYKTQVELEQSATMSMKDSFDAANSEVFSPNQAAFDKLDAVLAQNQQIVAGAREAAANSAYFAPVVVDQTEKSFLIPMVLVAVAVYFLVKGKF